MRLARDAQMKNMCTTEGLGRDLLNPCVAWYFLSISPKLQALTGPDRLLYVRFTCRHHLGFPLKHVRLYSPREALGGETVDFTKDEDGVAPQT